jgi:hypothetical protein
MGYWHHLELGAAAPERCVQRRHVPQEAPVLLQGDGVVRGGHQPPADVPHQQCASTGRRGPCGGLDGHGHDGLIEAARQPPQDSALPQLERRAAEAACGSHGPVLRQVETLEHVRLAANDHSFQRRARLARRMAERFPLGGLAEQAGQIVDHRCAVHRRPTPRLSHPRTPPGEPRWRYNTIGVPPVGSRPPCRPPRPPLSATSPCRRLHIHPGMNENALFILRDICRYPGASGPVRLH